MGLFKDKGNIREKGMIGDACKVARTWRSTSGTTSWWRWWTSATFSETTRRSWGPSSTFWTSSRWRRRPRTTFWTRTRTEGALPGDQDLRGGSQAEQPPLKVQKNEDLERAMEKTIVATLVKENEKLKEQMEEMLRRTAQPSAQPVQPQQQGHQPEWIPVTPSAAPPTMRTTLGGTTIPPNTPPRAPEPQTMTPRRNLDSQGWGAGEWQHGQGGCDLPRPPPLRLHGWRMRQLSFGPPTDPMVEFKAFRKLKR